MDNELMDYTAQKNFDFFKYRYEPQELKKQIFLTDCQKVLEGAHATVLEMLKLGARLAKLKRDGTWKEIVNPETGDSFNYESFESFSKYAFGFKKTRTSNLLSLAEFVELDDRTGEIVYKDARYRKMNTSQLIELAPLSESTRKYFSSDISVADMRLCKKYVETCDFWNERNKEGFDILSKAREWSEEQQRKKEIEEERAVNAEVQAEIERVREAAHNAGIPFSEKPWDPDEDFNPYVFDGSMSVEDYELMHKIMEEDRAKNSDVGTEEKQKYSFSTRGAVRKFLADFRNWDDFCGDDFFDEVYRFAFKNGMSLYATTCKTCIAKSKEVSASVLEERLTVFFFLHVKSGKQPIRMAKAKLEIWLKVNERYLL